jgi:signal transduction histidine kinase
LTADRRTRQGGSVTVHMDIIDLKEHEAELAAARDDAASANRAKSESLTWMSHELRTPLNAVLGFSDILKDESYGPHSDARYLEYSHDIHDGGCHLLRIINQILGLSKIEAGKYELMVEAFELKFSFKALTPFGQIQGSMNRNHQGAGLGLLLVRSFMPLHEGVMPIDSALEQGIAINLYFPRHRLIERNAA